MFPTGAAGVALLLLRGSVATTILIDATSRWAVVSFWISIAFVLLTTFLCLGFLTPYCCTLCCLIEVAILFTGSQIEFHLIVAILNGAAVAMLGPGAYSLDARIFGRRIVSVPARKTPDSD
jgi:hypothetical protein